MCLSAEASFGVGVVLVPAGVYCISAALRKHPAYLPLGAVPLFFAVQQFAEGLVWIGIDQGNAELVRVNALLFLFFALAFWPIWVPFCAMIAEQQAWRKLLLVAVTFASLLWT